MICLYNVLQSEVESILAKIKAQDIRYEKLKEAAPSKYEKQEFQNATEQLEQQLDTVKAKIDYALLFLKDALAGGKEAEIMIGMMLENENFQMLLQYRKLDMLIALYEEIHGRMNETQKEIRAWAGKE